MTDPSASRWPKAAWHLLFAIPNHETRVADLLQQRGFLVYLPSTIETHARYGTPYLRPIFPRYLFAHFTYGERWRILMTPGICEIVHFDSEPATLSDFEIERVRAIEQKLRSPRPKAQRGKVVSVQVGGLTLTGTVAGRRKQGMDVVLLRKAA